MSTFSIEELGRNSVYVVVELDDGSSFGQILHLSAAGKDEAIEKIKAMLASQIGARRGNGDLRTVLTGETGKRIDI